MSLWKGAFCCLVPQLPNLFSVEKRQGGRKVGRVPSPQRLLRKYLTSFPLSGRGSIWDQTFAKLDSKNCTLSWFSKQSGSCLPLTIPRKSCLDKDQYSSDEQATAVYHLCLEPPTAASAWLCSLTISAPKHWLKRENTEQIKGGQLDPRVRAQGRKRSPCSARLRCG